MFILFRTLPFPETDIFQIILFGSIHTVLNYYDLAFLHKFFAPFLTNYYVGEVEVDSLKQGSVLRELPRVIALNLSFRDGSYRLNYITKACRFEKSVRKDTYQTITKIKSSIGNANLHVNRYSPSDFKRFKFYEISLKKLEAHDIIPLFNTISGQLQGSFELFVCYKNTRFTSNFKPERPSVSEYDKREWICAGRIILAVRLNETEDPLALKYKLRSLNVKRRSFLHLIIVFNHLRLNKSFLASDFQASEFKVFRAPQKSYNIHYNKRLQKENRLLLGHIVDKGVSTAIPYYFEIDGLSKGAYILGDTGYGKTRYMAHIVNELVAKRNIGCLIINTDKKDQHKYYPDCNYISGNDLEVPYMPPEMYTENFHRAFTKICEFIAKINAGTIGLKNVLRDILQSEMTKLLVNQSKIVVHYGNLHNLIIDKLKQQYSKSTRSDLMDAVVNRQSKIQHHAHLFSYQNELPEWFSGWLNGTSYFIDLVDLPFDVQRIMICNILMLARYCNNRQETGDLQNLIFLDEIHKLFEELMKYQSEDDNMRTTLSMFSSVMREFLDEFRYLGFSLILADQKPQFLEYASGVGLKMRFHTSTAHLSEEYFAHEELMAMKKLELRELIAESGSETILIKTPEFQPKKVMGYQSESSEDEQFERFDEFIKGLYEKQQKNVKKSAQ